jgi:hypothetical protein
VRSDIDTVERVEIALIFHGDASAGAGRRPTGDAVNTSL